MKGRDILRQAARAIADQGLRASLSALGVLFGVATIVAALAVGEGARRRAYDEVAGLGIDNVFLRSRPTSPGYPAPARFAPGDVAAVAARLPSGVVTAAARTEPSRLHRGPASVPGRVAGVTPEWSAVAGAEVAAGRWLDADDVRERRRVIVLAPALARSLFADGRAVGGQLRWRGQVFRVVGVLAPSRRAAVQASAFVPLTTADMRLGPSDDVRFAQEIALAGAGDAEQAARAAIGVLTARGHRPDGFEVTVPRALLRAKLEAQRTFDRMLLGIGVIAVVISGVGIMNIMLASVSDRTIEIGVRRATGATRRDVLAQFAAEAVLLCAAGGAIGIPAGVTVAFAMAAAAGWPVAVSAGSLALAAGSAFSAGLVFGVYPAWRAAAVEPAAALRG